ncbi:hypothetical protein M758_8G119200 [Ceratodon purpureus]|nr:hypothetical protein M758_8G119200 [Ceratodon purpureus]
MAMARAPVALHEELSYACFVTEEKLLASLWQLPPFEGPTVFMLEVGEVDEKAGEVVKPDGDDQPEEVAFELIVRVVVPKKPIDDPGKDDFQSAHTAGRGYHMEDLYVRKPFRSTGFGTLLLKSVVQQAKKLGAGRVEWCVLNWNVNAIKFYEDLGAVVMPEWRICRLAGDALLTCAL